jgi:hypothetical protein
MWQVYTGPTSASDFFVIFSRLETEARKSLRTKGFSSICIRPYKFLLISISPHPTGHGPAKIQNFQFKPLYFSQKFCAMRFNPNFLEIWIKSMNVLSFSMARSNSPSKISNTAHKDGAKSKYAKNY